MDREAWCITTPVISSDRLHQPPQAHLELRLPKGELRHQIDLVLDIRSHGGPLDTDNLEVGLLRPSEERMMLSVCRDSDRA